MLSRTQMERRRARFERKRKDLPHIEAFLDASDPYSHLLEAILPRFEARYKIHLTRHYVGPPDDSAAPERRALAAYAAIDAKRLAERMNIDVDLTPRQAVGDTAKADARLLELGHYQGGMLYYGGEWYWGLDRLHYLETRLAAIAARRDGAPSDVIFEPPIRPRGLMRTKVDLHWYLSFRSPYTAIAARRVAALANAYGATLRLRFVLPMVMRDLPVPKEKRRYIIHDAAREADRLGILFGRICDPVGRPVERGYAILHWAIQQGRGEEFAQTFLHHVWAEGVDAGSDKGLRRIVENAGLSWAEASAQLGNEDWRGVAEANRAEMVSYGVWGVPSFRVGETAVWGQDRLWVVEDLLRSAS